MRIKELILLSLAFVFLVLSFPPFYLSALIFVSFPILLFAVRGGGKLKSSLYFGIVFCAFYIIHLRWILNLEVGPTTKALLYVGFFFLLLYMTAYWVLAGYIYGWLFKGDIRNLLDAFSFASMITLLELIRSKGVLGFPWSPVFESQLGNLPLAQTVAFIGPFGLTFLILISSFSLYLLFKRRKIPLIVIFLLILAEGSGYLRMKRLERAEGDSSLRVAIFQHNVLPREVETEEEWRETVEAMRELNEELKEEVDLIVTSESALPGYYRVSFKDKELVNEILSSHRAFMILGNADYKKENNEYVFFNTAFLLDSTGEIVSSYNKIHLVPFGEWLPYENWIAFLRGIELGQGNYRPGRELVIFDVKGIKLGTLICFESIFPEISRGFVKKGARILVNITSDGWYGRSLGPVEHFELCRFRSIENNVPLIRCAKTGISAVISPTGRVLKKLGLFKRGVLVYIVREGRDGTLYTKIGDLPIFILLLLIGLLGVVYNLKKSGGNQ